MSLSQQEANALIAEKMAQAEALVAECEQIATDANVSFSCDIGGFGMGGWFESGEWMASSQSC